MATMEWSGLNHRVIQTLTNRTAKADLNVTGVDHGNHDPFFIWEHSELITDAEASRFADRHLRLLERFCAEPDAPIAALELVDAAEREQLGRWAAGEADYERPGIDPGPRPARRRDRPGGGRRPRSRRGGRLRRAARPRQEADRRGAARAHGVGRGDRVGILLPRSPEGVAAHLGTLLAGAGYVPLRPRSPDRPKRRGAVDGGGLGGDRGG